MSVELAIYSYRETDFITRVYDRTYLILPPRSCPLLPFESIAGLHTRYGDIYWA
jgi:hypothetical protein